MWKNAPNGGLLTYKTERKKTCKFLKIAEMLEREKRLMSDCEFSRDEDENDKMRLVWIFCCLLKSMSDWVTPKFLRPRL